MSGRKTREPSTVNQRMAKAFKDGSADDVWRSGTEWAEMLNCAPSTVRKTATWRRIQWIRKSQRYHPFAFVDSINDRMMPMLSNPAVYYWTLEEWANRLGCKEWEIEETECWKKIRLTVVERRVDEIDTDYRPWQEPSFVHLEPHGPSLLFADPPP